MTERPASAIPAPPGLGGGSGAKPRHTWQATLRLTAYVLARGRSMPLVLVMTIGSVLLGVLGPWQLGEATNLLLAAQQADFDKWGLAVQLLVVAGLYAGASLLNAGQAWMINDIVQTVGRSLRAEAEAKFAKLPLAWFDHQPQGEVLSRVTNDIDNVVQGLQQLLSQALMSLLTLLGVAAMMLFLSPLLLLVALAAFALSLLISWIAGTRSQPHFAAQWRETGRLNSEVEETFTAHVLVKVYGHRQRTLDDFDRINSALASSALRAQLIGGVIQPATTFVSNLAYVAVTVVGAVRVLSGQFSIGELQAFIQYIRQIAQPISQISNMASTALSALASAERAFEVFDAAEMSPDTPRAGAGGARHGHVIFDRVSFRYRADQPFFEAVSIEVRPGQIVAIVGPTGAGKTTLVNLLMRFYEIDSGTISLDGTDIRDMTREDLRRQMGMVLQDSWLFTGTIRENIAYGRPDASEDEIIEAAKACHVHDFVETLPEGYDTVIGEGGAEISSGQQQLLTIARAFLMHPTVLILDEATSSVDTRTEILVQEATTRLRADRTSFVIAHRLSTIRNADLIIYMENGDVVEQGTHEQLLARRGAFWRLHRAQFEVAGEHEPAA